jgi:hypothetical protein
MEVGFMVEKIKENYFCFYKKKGYRYEDELGSKKIATVPQQWRHNAYWYFLTNVEESASVRNYRCSLHPGVFRVSYFSQGTEVLLLA